MLSSTHPFMDQPLDHRVQVLVVVVAFLVLLVVGVDVGVGVGVVGVVLDGVLLLRVIAIICR